jgi:hypothetical protein
MDPTPSSAKREQSTKIIASALPDLNRFRPSLPKKEQEAGVEVYGLDKIRDLPNHIRTFSDSEAGFVHPNQTTMTVLPKSTKYRKMNIDQPIMFRQALGLVIAGRDPDEALRVVGVDCIVNVQKFISHMTRFATVSLEMYNEQIDAHRELMLNNGTSIGRAIGRRSLTGKMSG